MDMLKEAKKLDLAIKKGRAALEVAERFGNGVNLPRATFKALMRAAKQERRTMRNCSGV